MLPEAQAKRKKLLEFFDRHRLDGVLLTRRDNFAWITCGRDNHIANNSPLGVATILATRDDLLCLASAVEAPRMSGQELVGTGIQTIAFPWHDAPAATRIVRDAIGGRTVVTDGEQFGLQLPTLPPDFAELRWSLCAEEAARFREGGKRASQAMESACRQLKPGMSGHDIAGVLDWQLRSAHLNPTVTLVATDDDIASFRHPIPRPQKLRRHAMLVTCAEFAGLISCVTRFVHAGPIPPEIRARQQAVCNVDAAVNLATRPGRTIGEIFDDLCHAYADNGFPDQWKLHHQGGSCGYNNREVVAFPGNTVKVLDNQPFAWNPSITGVKSEDTVLVTSKGLEVLTPHSSDWPAVEGISAAGMLGRAGILLI